MQPAEKLGAAAVEHGALARAGFSPCIGNPVCELCAPIGPYTNARGDDLSITHAIALAFLRHWQGAVLLGEELVPHAIVDGRNTRGAEVRCVARAPASRLG